MSDQVQPRTQPLIYFWCGAAAHAKRVNSNFPVSFSGVQYPSA